MWVRERKRVFIPLWVVVRVKNHIQPFCRACVTFVLCIHVFGYVLLLLLLVLKRVKFPLSIIFHTIRLEFVEFISFSEHACNTKLSPNFSQVKPFIRQNLINCKIGKCKEIFVQIEIAEEHDEEKLIFHHQNTSKVNELCAATKHPRTLHNYTSIH